MNTLKPTPTCKKVLVMKPFQLQSLFSPDGWLGLSLLPAVLMGLIQVIVVLCYVRSGLPFPRSLEVVELLSWYVVSRHFLWVMNRRYHWGLQFDLGLYSPMLEEVRGIFRAIFTSWTACGLLVALFMIRAVPLIILDLANRPLS